MAIVLLAAESGIKALSVIPPNLTNPVCIGTAALLASEGYDPYSSSSTSFLGTNSSFPLPFDMEQTSSRVSRWCPWDLQLQPPSRPNDGVYPYPDDSIRRPNFDPCYSACAKYNKPSDCCTELYDSPQKCKPGMYSKNAKAVCPDAYSFGMWCFDLITKSAMRSMADLLWGRDFKTAYDDQTSTFIVPEGAGFEIVFCPPGRSTNILITKAAQLRQLSQIGYVTTTQSSSTAVQVQVAKRRSESATGCRQPPPLPRFLLKTKSLWALVLAVAITMGILDVTPL